MVVSDIVLCIMKTTHCIAEEVLWLSVLVVEDKSWGVRPPLLKQSPGRGDRRGKRAERKIRIFMGVPMKVTCYEEFNV